jgi:serine/threonine-protein kinase HipA
MSGQLNVLLEHRVVATITNTPNDTNFVAIDRDFANDPSAPVLSFKAFRDPITRAYREVIRPTQTVAHPYFANLLPEGPLRAYLAAHARVKPIRDFPLLRLLGNDLPGALVMHDASGAAGPPEEEYEATGSGEVDPNLLRFSLAGVQLKFSATGDPQRGLTIPADGTGGSWIVKLPDARFAGVSENEYSMMEFARAVGIDVPRTGLAEPGEIGGIPGGAQFAGRAYYIERFDRAPGGRRIHTEDFAQANTLFPAQKYDRFNFDMLVTQVADLMGSDSAMELLRRIVFNLGIGNGDMHAKNWSVIYRDGRTPSLAPAYDYVSTVAYLPGDDTGSDLAGTKAFDQIDMDRIGRLAAHARLSTRIARREAADMVARMRDVWPAIGATLPLADEQRAAITAHLDSVPLFRGSAASVTGRTDARAGT